MSKLMTFEQYLNKNPNLYPENPPQINNPSDAEKALYTETQALLLGYFRFYQVCDNNRFGEYYRDSLNRSYRRYNELSRNEPGLAKYDWLVEDYLELQKDHASSTAGNTTKSGNKTQKRAIGQTVSTTGEDTDTSSGNTNGTVNGNTTKTGSSSDTKEYQGTHKTSETGSGTDALTYEGSKTVADTESGSDVLTYEGSKTVSGTESSENSKTYQGTEKNHSTRTPNLTQETDETGSTSSEKDGKTIGKAMPMTASYPNAAAGAIPDLSWTNPSTQGQTNEKDTGSSSSNATVKNTGNETNDDEKTFENRADVDSGSGTKEETESFTGRKDDRATTGSKESKESFDGRKDSRATSDAKETEETFADRADVNTGSASEEGTSKEVSEQTTSQTMTHAKGTTITTTPDADKEDSESEQESAENNGSESSSDYERHTGRHGNIAEMIKQADEFIKQSSAFQWLCGQLAENFLMVYDVSDIYDEISAWD